jgi:ABC-2 type transport system ATP-binding protein
MKPFIRTEGIVKRYGSLTAVNNLNIEIFNNEIYALLGPNGAGKTTTINMLCGLSAPDEGKILFPETESKERKLLTGYCPQDNIFYPKLTCLEQLIFIGQMYGIEKKKAKTEGIRLLNLLGLEEKARVKACELSGGMKRRLNICLALIHDPEIMILDEPEAGLDPQSRILVREFIKSMSREKCIILTTHNMDEADRIADRISIMDRGEILVTGTPSDLKRGAGEGDFAEIVTCNEDKDLANFAGVAAHFCDEVKIGHGSVLLRGRDISHKADEIRMAAAENGLEIKEIKFRGNTLEDLFISLTGRSLRE